MAHLSITCTLYRALHDHYAIVEHIASCNDACIKLSFVFVHCCRRTDQLEELNIQSASGRFDFLLLCFEFHIDYYCKNFTRFSNVV